MAAVGGAGWDCGWLCGGIKGASENICTPPSPDARGPRDGSCGAAQQGAHPSSLAVRLHRQETAAATNNQWAMAMSCVCRHAARTVFKSVRTTTMIAPAMIAKGPSSFVTTTAVKGLSYESGGQGQSPWSGHGGGGGGDMMGGSDRPPRRVVERRRGDW